MKQPYTYFVYILLCSDRSYYTGVTNDLDKRLYEHQHGLIKKCYTYKRRPVKLVWNGVFNDIRIATGFERQVKGWTRKKKEALINGDWDQMHEYARCKNGTSHRNMK